MFKAEGGKLKEFILDDGLHILVILFPDSSGAVYKKIGDSGMASAEFVPVTMQKNYLKKLDVRYEADDTYAMIKQVIND